MDSTEKTPDYMERKSYVKVYKVPDTKMKFIGNYLVHHIHNVCKQVKN